VQNDETMKSSNPSAMKKKKSFSCPQYCGLFCLFAIIVATPLFLTHQIRLEPNKWFHHQTPKVAYPKIEVSAPSVITNIPPSSETVPTRSETTPHTVQSTDLKPVSNDLVNDAQNTNQPIDSASEQLNVIEKIQKTLKMHPLRQLSEEQISTFKMEDYFVYLSEQSICKDLPIFTSMANIFSELYWQL
jgi:hypothetical protein